MLEPEYGKFQLPNERIKKVKVSSHWYSWKEQLVLPFELYREKVDLMHFPHFNSPIVYRGKNIVTIHDLTPKFFPGHKIGRYWHRRFGFNQVFFSTVRKADKVIAVSNHTKKDIIKFFGAPEEKVVVVYEGIPCIESGSMKQEPGINNLKEKYNITKPFIFYLGVWRDHKNLVGLIRAFNILRKKYKMDLELVFGGGEDSHYPEIRQTWQNLKLTKYLIRPGFIPEEEIPLFYQAASLFVNPSFYEGFGLVTLEAMTHGTPVVCSKTTSLPEVLGKAAVYFNPHDPEDMAQSIKRVLERPNLQEQLIKTGFEQVKRYSWQKMAEETLEIYDNVLNR